jgi:predicted NAD/FAD-dependent oxidoreductase
MAPPRTVGVIGGGVAGLMCATRCQELGLVPTVFDTGKHAVGGRASSRRLAFQGVDGASVALRVDHAAQFFLAQREPFQRYVRRWAADGGVERWAAQLAVLSKGKAFRPTPSPGEDSDLCRWVAPGGMGELWRRVAAELDDVQCNIWVSALERTQDGAWRLLDGHGGLLAQVDFVVIAHNGKCADRLMARAGVPRIHRLLQCKFAPKVTSPAKMHLSSLWMLVAVFERPLELPWAGAEIEDHPVLSWAGNNHSKPINAADAAEADGAGARYEAWSLLSTPAFGTAHKCPQEAIPAHKRAQVTELMLQAFYQVAGLIGDSGRGPQPVHTFVQLWGAAVPLNVLAGGAASALDAASAVGVCGDWFTSPCIEGAAESGIHLAELIAAEAAGASRSSVAASTVATVEAPAAAEAADPPSFAPFASHAIGDVPLDAAELERARAIARRACSSTTAGSSQAKGGRAKPQKGRGADSRRTQNSRSDRRPSTAPAASSSSGGSSQRSRGGPISGGFCAEQEGQDTARGAQRVQKSKARPRTGKAISGGSIAADGAGGPRGGGGGSSTGSRQAQGGRGGGGRGRGRRAGGGGRGNRGRGQAKENTSAHGSGGGARAAAAAAEE